MNGNQPPVEGQIVEAGNHVMVDAKAFGAKY